MAQCDFLASAGPDAQCPEKAFYDVKVPFPDKTVTRKLCMYHTDEFVQFSSWSHHKVDYRG